jgi:hypothetical protein
MAQMDQNTEELKKAIGQMDPAFIFAVHKVLMSRNEANEMRGQLGQIDPVENLIYACAVHGFYSLVGSSLLQKDESSDEN